MWSRKQCNRETSLSTWQSKWGSQLANNFSTGWRWNLENPEPIRIEGLNSERTNPGVRHSNLWIQYWNVPKAYKLKCFFLLTLKQHKNLTWGSSWRPCLYSKASHFSAELRGGRLTSGIVFPFSTTIDCSKPVSLSAASVERYITGALALSTIRLMQSAAWGIG